MAIITSNLTKISKDVEIIQSAIGVDMENPIETPIVEVLEEAKAILSEKAVIVIEDEYESLEDFVSATGTEDDTHKADSKFVKFKDTAGWGPLEISDTWYKGFVVYQNHYGDDIIDSVDGCLTLYTSDNITYNGFISGNKTNGVAVTWTKVATVADLDELKKSVSDGKLMVADAITAKGVETATDASFVTLAENIAKIISETTGGDVAVESIWTNTSITSFGENSTIELDLTNYQYIVIGCVYGGSVSALADSYVIYNFINKWYNSRCFEVV